MNGRMAGVVLGLALIVTLGVIVASRGPSVSAEAGKPLLILYWEEDFQGPSLEVSGSLPDLPVQLDGYRNEFNWNDQVRSVVVTSGTWRLYQNGRANTRLDETPLSALDVGLKEKEAGWSCLVSATSKGALAISSGAAGGFYHDISSIELVSEENLPDWAAPGGSGQ